MSGTSPGYSLVAISGSPSATSKTALLAEHVLALATRPGESAIHYRVSSLSPAALLSGDMKDPLLAEMVDAVAGAHGVIIATPIYKAAYSGLLKCFLDVLPQFALAGSAVLPLATGGSVAHVLALDYALRPVLQSMGARHIVQSHFVAEPYMRVDAGRLVLDPETASPLTQAIHHFRHTLTDLPEARHLGHPRPPTI
jgi:FMN reductase